MVAVPILSSLIAAVSCSSLSSSSLLPNTVILMNLLSASVRSYVSNVSVDPLASPP